MKNFNDEDEPVNISTAQKKLHSLLFDLIAALFLGLFKSTQGTCFFRAPRIQGEG